MLIDSRRIGVERYVRQGDFWEHSTVGDPDAVLELASIGCLLPLQEIYADVELPAGKDDGAG